MGIKFSESTIKSGFLVQMPDWYKLNITKHIEKDSSDKKSKNHIYLMEVTGSNPGELQEKMVGVPISFLVNEGADWIALPLFKACLGGEVTPDTEYNWEDLVGVTIEGYVQRGERQDHTPMNTVTEFAPLGTNLPKE